MAKPVIGKQAQARIDLAGELMAQVLQRGGIPEIVIAAKPTPETGPSGLTYFVASPLEEDKIHYILTRVIGLLDGSIKANN